MRGDDQRQSGMFSYISPEKRVPKGHPLRPIREMVDRALEELSPRFETLYARTGRPSIAPERLLRALLLQVLYTVRSERQLMEQLDYNLLFRWFVGLNADDPVWDPTVFTKNRDRLLAGDVAQAFFEAWASHKSLVRRDDPERRESDDDPGNPTVNFRGPAAEQRDARLGDGSRGPACAAQGGGVSAGLPRPCADWAETGATTRRPSSGPCGCKV
jgi:transposase